MALCFDCGMLFGIEGLRYGDILLKEDLAELIASAEDGCQFCQMCWASFQEQCEQEMIENHLRLLPDELLRDSDVKVHVSMRLDELRYNDDKELCDSRTFSNCRLAISTGPINAAPDDYTLQLKLEAELSVFADPGTLAGEFIRGRHFTLPADLAHAISWIRKCLLECNACHKDCAPVEHREMPTRVIDLGHTGQQTPYILETKGRLGKYLALSYCWGDGVKHQVKLKKATYTAMLQGFDESPLTTSHKEALQIARELGFQFVWIDALCIIQDDAADWENESSRMTECYLNANLTLVAGRSANSSRGFIGTTSTPSMEPLRFEYTHEMHPGQKSYWCICLPRNIDTGPVEERAWCFQEDILSRRSLIFGVDQLFIRCQERLYHEAGIVVNHSIHEVDGEDLMDLTTFASKCNDPEMAREKMLLQWYRIVGQYTARTMFEPHDVFAALMGLAKVVQRALRCQYLAGLWEDDLVRGLLWQGRGDMFPGAGFTPLRRPAERNTKKPERLGLPAIRAPSWSWASVEGGVTHSPFHTQENDKRRFDEENVCVRPLYGNPPRWSPRSNCEVDKAFMPNCELEMLGVPKLANCGTRPVPDQAGKDAPWRFAGARVGEFATLTDVRHPDNIVGMGLFDVKQEQTDLLWCMRLIRDRGLMLRRDQYGKFHRLGKFVVVDQAFFEDEPAMKVALV